MRFAVILYLTQVFVCGWSKGSTLATSYSRYASIITDYLLNGEGKGETYLLLSNLVDKFGSRMVGTPSLERAIDYVVNQMKTQKLDNVHTEEDGLMSGVSKNWQDHSDRLTNENILGLGTTVSTPSSGITADGVVISSFEELETAGKKGQLIGKIIVFNQPWTGSYGGSAVFRIAGASRASAHGAVATLIRSATPFSLYSPHTGVQDYDPNMEPIPTASITVEDAELMHRMQKSGNKLRLFLKITSHPSGNTTSRNTIAQITGWQYPKDVVLISGHMDSWDVGQGAMDDGGGVAISWQTLLTLKALGLTPRRTIRAVLWTAEEMGGFGAQHYYTQHNRNTSNENFVFVMESDLGAFKPNGVTVTGSSDVVAIIKELAQLLSPINASQVFESRSPGTDVNPWILNENTPGATLSHNKYDYYFMFHHTNADTMTVFEPSDLDFAAVLWTVISYVIADMPHSIDSANVASAGNYSAANQRCSIVVFIAILVWSYRKIR